MSIFSIAIIVVLLFVFAAGGIINRYRKQLLGCQLWLGVPHMVERIGLTPSVAEYYLNKTKSELPNYQMLWPTLWAFAVGNILLCWIILPYAETSNVLSILTAFLIATIITRALTIEDDWIISLLQKFNDPASLVDEIESEMKAAEPELRKALTDLFGTSVELEKATKELEEELRKIYQAAQSIAKQDKQDKKD
jgi:hypothetical protein